MKRSRVIGWSVAAIAGAAWFSIPPPAPQNVSPTAPEFWRCTTEAINTTPTPPPCLEPGTP